MPICTVLSARILAVQMLAGEGLAAVLWFAGISVINGPRIVLAVTQSDTIDRGPEATGARLSLFGGLALASGIAWSFLAVLSDGQGFLFSAALPPRDALAFDADHFGYFASAESFFDPVTLSLRNRLSGRAA
ncbi:hypothetical protein [Mesorhizobium sp. 43Arga]